MAKEQSEPGPRTYIDVVVSPADDDTPPEEILTASARVAAVLHEAGIGVRSYVHNGLVPKRTREMADGWGQLVTMSDEMIDGESVLIPVVTAADLGEYEKNRDRGNERTNPISARVALSELIRAINAAQQADPTGGYDGIVTTHSYSHDAGGIDAGSRTRTIEAVKVEYLPWLMDQDVITDAIHPKALPYIKRYTEALFTQDASS